MELLRGKLGLLAHSIKWTNKKKITGGLIRALVLQHNIVEILHPFSQDFFFVVVWLKEQEIPHLYLFWKWFHLVLALGSKVNRNSFRFTRENDGSTCTNAQHRRHVTQVEWPELPLWGKIGILKFGAVRLGKNIGKALHFLKTREESFGFFYFSADIQSFHLSLGPSSEAEAWRNALNTIK